MEHIRAAFSHLKKTRIRGDGLLQGLLNPAEEGNIQEWSVCLCIQEPDEGICLAGEAVRIRRLQRKRVVVGRDGLGVPHKFQQHISACHVGLREAWSGLQNAVEIGKRLIMAPQHLANDGAVVEGLKKIRPPAEHLAKHLLDLPQERLIHNS